MANAIASQVQALYVGYLGRAADQAGLDFWTNAIANGTSTLESVALGFTLSTEYQSLYADKTSEELAAAIYQNVLGRAADADGLAFWVGEIENGTVTADTLLAAMLNSLGTVDQQTIDNKVYVANAYTAAAGSDYDADAGAAILVGVDSTAASVAAALASVPAINSAGLTAALASLASAEAALDSFLQSTALGDDPATEAVEETVRADVLNEVDNAGTGVVSQFNADYGTALAEDSTANARTAAYGSARAAAEADILAAKDAVAVAQAAVTATGTATAAEIAAYKTAIANEEATTAAVTSSLNALGDAELLFGGANHQNGAGIDSDVTMWTGVKYEADADAAVDDNLIVASSTAGVFEVEAGIVAAGTATGATAAQKLLLADAKAILSAYQAAYDAEKADAAAETALATAAGKLGDPAAQGEVDALIAAQVALATEQEDAAALEADIADVEAAYGLYAQLLTLEGNVEKAVETINAAGWNVDALVGAVDATDFLGAGGTADLANDVFLFAGEDSIGSTIANFGLAGTDLIKFAAGEYTLVNVSAADFGNKALGSASALEIFVVDDGVKTTVHVEQNAFDGSTISAQANLVDITLTGVTGDTASLSDTGYLSFA